MSDSNLQQNAVSWHQVICFLSSCNYTNDVNEIHKIFTEWGIECMGNNTQLHHFTNYQSVVFIRCLYFYSGFIVLSFHQTSPTNSTRKTFLLKSLSYAPQCLHLFGSPRNLFFCSTSRFITIFGASVGSPGSARAVEKPWRGLRCSSRSRSLQRTQRWCHRAPYLDLSPVQQPRPFCAHERN